MVNIKIQNGHSIDVGVIQGRDGGNGDAVEQTKPHGAVPFGVVTRRSDRAEYPLLWAVQYCVHAGEDRAGGEPGGAHAGDAHPGIRIQG